MYNKKAKKKVNFGEVLSYIGFGLIVVFCICLTALLVL